MSVYQQIDVASHVVLGDGTICLHCSTPEGAARRLTTPLEYNYANFTMLQAYVVHENRTVSLNHSVCDDECGHDCTALGEATFTESQWNAVVSGSTDCLTVPTVDGLHPDDPYIYQRFESFDVYTAAHAGVFPAAFTTQPPPSSAPPIGEDDSSDGAPIGMIVGVSAGGAVLLIVALALLVRQTKPSSAARQPAQSAPQRVLTEVAFTNSFC